MDESKLVDWYEVVEAVANGRLTGHSCPICGVSPLSARRDGSRVRVTCEACGEGFEGQLAHGRDDALYAEAVSLERDEPEPVATAEAAETPEAVPDVPEAEAEAPPPRRPAPWAWELPASSQNDWEGFAVWHDVVEAIYNGRRTGLSCPFCSEPLEGIVHEDPYIRVRCDVCGEGFEGRLG